MNDMADDTLTRYYEDAASWGADRHRALKTSRRIAWIVAGIASGIALLEGIALAGLTPLKTAVPYTLLVDRQTGNVEALQPMDKQVVTPDTALVRSYLAQYVTARESFDIASLNADYRKAALWSAGDARERYVKGMQAGNPDSPLASLPRQAIVETQIRSISSLGQDTALVRFSTIRTDSSAPQQGEQTWAAVIQYRFSPAAMTEADRLINPLGFQVLRYRRNAEMVPENPPSDMASPSSPTP